MDTLIVIDVQPFYEDKIYFDVSSLINHMQEYDKIVVFFNGEELGCDSLHDIYQYFLEYGMDESFIYDIEWVEKSYGFLRGWMDTGIDDDDIVRVLRHMYEQDITDSRDLDFADSEIIADDCIFLPDFDCIISDNKVAICGGSDNECLKEMELYFKATGTITSRVYNYIY